MSIASNERVLAYSWLRGLAATATVLSELVYESIPQNVAELTLVSMESGMYAIAIASIPSDLAGIDHLEISLKIGSADSVVSNYPPDTLQSATFAADPGIAIHAEAVYVGVDPTNRSPVPAILDTTIAVVPPTIPNVAALSIVTVPDEVVPTV